MTDVVSTLGVLIGVLLAIATGYTRLDSILAGLVGVTILWSGWQLIKESVIGLMDVSVEPKLLATIREVISTNAEGAIEAHDIRTRQSGRITFIEFHLVVAGGMTVEDAHAICDRIEAKLREAVTHAQVTIHVEPEEKAKHSGIVGEKRLHLRLGQRCCRDLIGAARRLQRSIAGPAGPLGQNNVLFEGVRNSRDQ
eukprot:gene63299-86594_t